MKKLQLFQIVKLESNRLKEARYNIRNFSFDESLLNGEIITLSNSQMVRSVLELKGRPFSEIELAEFETKKKLLQKRKQTPKSKIILSGVMETIRKTIFIPEIISVRFSDKRHYMNILKRGYFTFNSVNYVPFMASAGMLRRDSVLFIEESLFSPLMKKFNNGRDMSIEIVPAKFSAYFSLYSSSSFDVSFPNIAVIPDNVFKAMKRVNYGKYVETGEDPKIEEREMEIEFNAFDGQGLCSPSIAEVWRKELELDYLPSYFGVRAPYIKGQCTVFDFHDFARSVAKQEHITDIYGNRIEIKNIDCLISESQFKLWQSYTNTDDYVSKCRENGLGWGITKVSPKVDKNHARTSYQFLQVLDLDNEQVERLCRPTIDWLSESSGGSLMSTMMYALGETEFTEGWFDRVDNITRAVLLDNTLLNDDYVRKHYSKSLSKKMNDARMGRLMMEGNYQCMIADPFAQAAFAFGLGTVPLLKDKEHYSKYWQNKGINKVIAIRSPIVHHGEVNVLNLQNNEKVNYWYKYIYSGIVYPASGVGMDAMIHGGSDFDLDIVCTINSQEMLDGIIPDLPVVYDVKKPPKSIITEDNLFVVYNAQAAQVKTNKIGFYTNVSSAMYALLANYEKGSEEYEILMNRLRWGRVLQGTEIDKTKGVSVDPYPEHFTKYTRVTEQMRDEEKGKHFRNNRLLAEKRPYFMRWLYPDYNAAFVKERLTYDTISMTKWGVPFSDIEKSPKTVEQEQLLSRYKKRTFFINNDSTMNRISRHVQDKVSDIKVAWRKAEPYDYTRLLSSVEGSVDSDVVKKMKVLFKEYKSLRRSLYTKTGGEITFEDNVEICSYINDRAYKTISSNSSELVDAAIVLCYKVLGKNSKSFLWNVFGTELVDIMKVRHPQKYVRVPMYNLGGSKRYLWTQYGVYTIQIKSD